MDDGDDFPDDFQDDVDFDAIERSAIEATQHHKSQLAYQSGTSTRKSAAQATARAHSPSSDYGLDDEGDVVDLGDGGPVGDQRAGGPSEGEKDAQHDEVSRREQWRQQRYAEPARTPASQNNGSWQQYKVPMRASQGQPPASQKQPQYRLTRPPQAAPHLSKQANGQTHHQNRSSTPTQSSQETHHTVQQYGAQPVGNDPVALQARIAALEAEQSRLRRAAEEAKSALHSKAGEISIVRSNHDRVAKEYEQKVAAMQKQHAEEVAKQRLELEAARKDMEKSETDRRFLEHDMREEAKKRANAARGAAKGPASPAVTPRKTRSKKMGDGFDDDEVMMVSPSKSMERRERGTPSKNGMAAKRKRLVQSDQASPGRALPLSESAGSFEELRSVDDASFDVKMPLRPKTNLASGASLEFIQTILNHRHDLESDRTIERLTKHAFPTNPTTSLSSIIYDYFTPSDASAEYQLGFCELIMNMWTRCLDEKFYAPMRDLHGLIQAVLFEADVTLTSAFITRIVPLCLKTADLVALPMAKAMGNPTQHQPPSAELKSQIRTVDYVELLDTVAVSICASNELLSEFWSAIQFDILLVLISKVQPLAQKAAMLGLLTTSIIPESFGPRAPEAGGNNEAPQQMKYQSDLLDRLTVMLLEKVETPATEPAYEAADVLSLRASLLDLFRQMCLTEWGGRILATHRVFIGRLVRFLHESVVAIKIAFVEGVSVLERGIDADVAEAAHRMLDEHLSPEEGEAVVESPQARVGHPALSHVAVTATPDRLARAMLERWVPVPNVLKVVQILRLRKQAQCQTVHGCVTPSLVVEAARSIQVGEELAVLGRPEKVEVCNLKVAPEVAEVPGIAAAGARVERGGKVRQDQIAHWPGRPAGVHHSRPKSACGDAAVVLVVGDGAEEAGGGTANLPQGHGVAVGLVVGGHHSEGIVGDGAGELDVGLDAPVPVVQAQGGVVEEVAALEAAHVVVGLASGVGHAPALHVAHALARRLALALAHPRRPAPHVLRDLLEGGGARDLLAQGPHEARVPGGVVEEDDGVVEVAVELSLERADGCDGAVKVAVASQHDDGGILAWCVAGCVILILAAEGKGRIEG
ncbi:hypothetical protein FH972_021583 [Carpinus fangiana]|uniref:Uncharacterized protein n=1 Tax=Carpinus fangiana TaxID=176857 RepID=A0A5N6KPP4_9ROSI|nr:hypothetical protein FH972_021583 [Carpinus fangiana]